MFLNLLENDRAPSHYATPVRKSTAYEKLARAVRNKTGELTAGKIEKDPGCFNPEIDNAINFFRKL